MAMSGAVPGRIVAVPPRRRGRAVRRAETIANVCGPRAVLSVRAAAAVVGTVDVGEIRVGYPAVAAALVPDASLRWSTSCTSLPSWDWRARSSTAPSSGCSRSPSPYARRAPWRMRPRTSSFGGSGRCSLSYPGDGDGPEHFWCCCPYTASWLTPRADRHVYGAGPDLFGVDVPAGGVGVARIFSHDLGRSRTRGES